MKNQFFYTRKEEIKTPVTENDSVELQFSDRSPITTKIKEFNDSFNVDMIIRTIELEDGQRLVLLNDIHERFEKIPQFNSKKQIKSFNKERNTFQSELYLSKEDNDRFVKFLS